MPSEGEHDLCWAEDSWRFEALPFPSCMLLFQSKWGLLKGHLPNSSARVQVLIPGVRQKDREVLLPLQPPGKKFLVSLLQLKVTRNAWKPTLKKPSKLF